MDEEEIDRRYAAAFDQMAAGMMSKTADAALASIFERVRIEKEKGRKKMTVIEPWVYVVEHGSRAPGANRRLWLRQDGLGKWIVTQEFQMRPEYYLTIDGQWSDRATSDTRHEEHTARNLALGWLMQQEAEGGE